MDRFRVNYDRTARHWILNREGAGGGRVVARRLFLEVDATMEAGGVFVCEGILRGSLVSAGASSAVLEEAHIERMGKAPAVNPRTPTGREALPEGRVNKEAMREWCVVFDEPSGTWQAYRQDGQALVTAKRLELGCHAVSSDGVLHCLAEALVDGSTHRKGTIGNAASLRLRTLVIFDQAVQMPLILSRGAAKSPG